MKRHRNDNFSNESLGRQPRISSRREKSPSGLEPEKAYLSVGYWYCGWCNLFSTSGSWEAHALLHRDPVGTARASGPALALVGRRIPA